MRNPLLTTLFSSLFKEIIKTNYKEPTAIELTNQLAYKMHTLGISEIITSDNKFSIRLNERG